MKYLPLLAGLVLLIAVVSGQAHAETCYTEAMVTEAQGGPRISVFPMDKKQIDAFIVEFAKRFPDGVDPANVPDNAVAFSDGRTVKIIYFADGCATYQTLLPWKTFVDVVGKSA